MPSRRAAVAMLFLMLPPAIARADDGAASADAHDTVRFRLGVGVGSVRFPDYPGAIETRSLTLPFPYVVLYHEHLKVDNNRVRGIVFTGSHWSLDVDFSGQPQVESDRTRERLGMPDLGWLGEAGPALRYNAWRDEVGETEFDLVLPIRMAVTAEGLTLTHRGDVFAPRLELNHDLFDMDGRLEWDVNLTAEYEDRNYTRYYYGVAPQYATATRAAYAPPGGYAGYRAEIGFSLHEGDLAYGAFANYTNLDHAAFLSSPLVGRREGWSFGFSIAWVIQRQD